MTATERLKKLSVAIPEIYLPSKGVDLSKFAVIACDQYTSRLSYWERVKETVGDSPSTLNLMLPEIYLEKDNTDKANEIHRSMDSYLSDGVLSSIGECFVYVKRQLESGCRHGLVLALDLENYDYHCSASSMIRATEKTVENRLPPRMDIRRGAPLETPHIIILIDDKKNRLIEYLSRQSFPCLYDFEFMERGGRISGYKVDGEQHFADIADIFDAIKADGGDNFLFAVGDGNHSLACAKACWDEIKETLPEDERENHPARYALVEVESLFDPSIIFEPIHRVVFGIDRKTLEQDIDLSGSAQEVEPRLDAWLPDHKECRVDYIHGADEANDIAQEHGGAAIVFDAFEKDTLFDCVRKNGSLVRKSFSMGKASTKRFYLECRKIV